MIDHVTQTVRGQETDELEVSPGKILERDKKIATEGDQVDTDSVTTGINPINVERPKERSNNERQGTQSPAPPAETTTGIEEKHHVSKTLPLLSSPSYDEHTMVVSAFETDITRKDFEKLHPNVMLNDNHVNWMLRWWSSQVNGRFGNNPPPPKSNPHMTRCFFASTFWYARMTPDGVFSYDNVKRWTKKFEILRQYDLMLIPIHIQVRKHFILAVVDFNKKNTVIYDSLEQDALRPGHPEVHAHLMTWLTRKHQERSMFFDAQVWKAVRGQQTPQQGTRGNTDVDCGVFVLAFAMYLSTNRPFSFNQQDMPNLRNWIAEIMLNFGIGNNTFAPTHSNMDQEGPKLNI